jgi:hypothetical protein
MRCRRALIPAGLILLGAVLSSPGAAYGWGSTWAGVTLEQVVNAAHWRLGRLRAYAAMRLDNVGYDTNIYYGSGTRVPDFTARAGPSVRLFLPLEKSFVLDISEFPQYAFYAKSKTERSWNNTFRGQVHFVLDKFYIRLGEGLTDAKELLSTELALNIRNKSSNPTAFVLWQMDSGTSASLQYRRFTYNYFNPDITAPNIRQNLNRSEDYANFTLYLQQAAKIRYYIDGEYGKISFTEAASQPRNTQTYTVYGGLDFLPAPPGEQQPAKLQGVQGRINLGFKRFDILDPTLKDFSGLVGNSSVTVHAFGTSAVQGSFVRDVRFSAFAEYTYYLETTYGIGFVSAFSTAVLLTYDFFIGRNSYPLTPTGVPGEATTRIDNFNTHSIRLNLRMRKDLVVSLLANIGRRTSSIGLPSNRSFFGLSLMYGYETQEGTVVSTPASMEY